MVRLAPTLDAAGCDEQYTARTAKHRVGHEAAVESRSCIRFGIDHTRGRALSSVGLAVAFCCCWRCGFWTYLAV
jgi:hypothetical protein